MDNTPSYDVIVIGGGASGFFAAINAKETNKALKVVIIEKTTKVLSKVKVSGGGRCNVTNAEPKLSEFLNHYPRGKNFLKKAFGVFGPKETIQWFEDHGLRLKTEPDGRMFPTSNMSQSVIDLFTSQCHQLGIEIKTQMEVLSIVTDNMNWKVVTKSGDITTKKVIVALGGMAKEVAMGWARALNIETVKPVPSLFTFKTVEKDITKLMGLSVDLTEMKISGIKRMEKAPVLITHWGFSGPATIKTSAWQARTLFEEKYQFQVLINWLGELNEAEAIEKLTPSDKQLKNIKINNIPQRLWDYLLKRARVEEQKLFNELAKKDKFRLINTLINDSYAINGKSTFKEEFVTAGGIALSEVSPKTMETVKHQGLYIVGEALDIDGVTGGFNFQAAWSTGYIAGTNAATTTTVTS